MRRPLTSPAAPAAAALVALALALAPAGVAAKPARATPWATVNICDTSAAPDKVGVRAFMPARGTAAQWARIRMEYWDGATSRWKPVRRGGDGGWARLGSGRGSVYGGTTFAFNPPDAGHRLVLRGVADLEWRSGHKVTARATVRTTAGHGNRKDPALKRSRAACEITA